MIKEIPMKVRFKFTYLEEEQIFLKIILLLGNGRISKSNISVARRQRQRTSTQDYNGYRSTMSFIQFFSVRLLKH